MFVQITHKTYLLIRENSVLLHNEPNLIVLFGETISVFMRIIGNVLMRYVFKC